MSNLLNLCFNCNGNIGRRQYFLGMFLTITALFIILFITAIFPPNHQHNIYNVITALLYLFIFILFIISVTVLVIKRLRDIGWNTALVLLNFLPFVNHIFWIVILFMPSEQRVTNTPLTIQN